MEDEASNDSSVVAIITSDEDDDSPIKKLFKRLINNDCKQHTVLTNNQILDLLRVEFNINPYKLHNLEIDIYIMLVKRFLKDWPLWEDFDKMVNDGKKKNNLASVEDMLQSKYSHLKTYLQSVLDIAVPLAKEEVLKLKNAKQFKCEDKEIAQDVVMEISATRNQLNSLFLRYPGVYSVFNVNPPKSVIVVAGLKKMDSILNWWDVNIEITMKNKKGTFSTIYKRQMQHKLKHILVNKVLPNNNSSSKIHLNQKLFLKNQKKSKLVNKNLFINFFGRVAQENSEQGLKEILEFIQKDWFLMPHSVYTFANYKRYMSAYPYVRYLYKNWEITKENPKFDLQLEETICPMYQLYVGGFTDEVFNLDSHSIKIECICCKIIFSGPTMTSDLRQHFEGHCIEVDWTCTNCKSNFPMLDLASRWWGHICTNNTITSENDKFLYEEITSEA